MRDSSLLTIGYSRYLTSKYDNYPDTRDESRVDEKQEREIVYKVPGEL